MQQQAETDHTAAPWTGLFAGADDFGGRDARRLIAWTWVVVGALALAFGALWSDPSTPFAVLFLVAAVLIPGQLLIAAATGRIAGRFVRDAGVALALLAGVRLIVADDLRTDILVALACAVGAVAVHLLLMAVLPDGVVDVDTAKLAGVGGFVLGLHSIAAAVAGTVVLPVVLGAALMPVVVGVRAFFAPLLDGSSEGAVAGVVAPTATRSAFSYNAGLAAAIALLLVWPGLPGTVPGL